MDIAVYVLLGLVIGLGIAEIGRNTLGGGYDYRATVAVLSGSIVFLHPEPSKMVGVPVIYQLHATAAWLLLLVWPFTRLVHAWSIPLQYRATIHSLPPSMVTCQTALDPRSTVTGQAHFTATLSDPDQGPAPRAGRQVPGVAPGAASNPRPNGSKSTPDSDSSRYPPRPEIPATKRPPGSFGCPPG